MNAITFGRYNFFTIAHLNTVNEILKKWKKLYILIVDDSLGNAILFSITQEYISLLKVS